ncbi:MAG: hypothetical protein JNM17_01680 [Archangium sp.]|nr:hypothetical protein [Archangium sp.]
MSEMSEKRQKRSYLKPVVRTAPVAAPPVLLACTGRVDCDALFGTGPCCADTEQGCENC